MDISCEVGENCKQYSIWDGEGGTHDQLNVRSKDIENDQNVMNITSDQSSVQENFEKSTTIMSENENTIRETSNVSEIKGLSMDVQSELGNKLSSVLDVKNHEFSPLEDSGNENAAKGRGNSASERESLSCLLSQENKMLNSDDKTNNINGTINNLICYENEESLTIGTKGHQNKSEISNHSETLIEDGRVVPTYLRTESANDLEEDGDFDILANNKSGRRLLTVFDSDSENEIETSLSHSTFDHSNNVQTDLISESNDKILGKLQSKRLKRIAVIDSDSDDENSDTISKNHCPEKAETSSEIFVINKQGKLVTEDSIHLGNQKNILSNICDPESSNDSSEGSNDEHEENVGEISESELKNLQTEKLLSTKKERRQKTTQKEEKMTAKKALEERKEILAESQRRVRDSQISLPYHRPKPRTLKEFLQKRPKLALPLDGIPHGRSPVTAIKMSTDQLKIISCKLKEREKELKEFYKSESESENENNEESSELSTIAIDQNTPKEIGGMEVQEQLNEIQENMSEDIRTIVENNEKDLCVHQVLNEITETEKNSEYKESSENAEHIVHVPENKCSSDANVVQEELDSTVSISNITEICCNIMETDNDNSQGTLLQSNNQADHLKKNMGDKMEIEPSENCNKMSDTSVRIEMNEQSQQNMVDSETETKTKENIKIISSIVFKPLVTGHNEKLYFVEDELLEVNDNDKGCSDSYEFNLDDIADDQENIPTEEKQATSKSELMEKLVNIKPRLSGAPNHLIDLENDDVIPDEVTKLRERFLQHNVKIRKHDHKTEISVLSVTNGEIHKETVMFNIHEDDDENTAPLEKPGVRMKKLRESLQLQMAQRRSDMWKGKLEKTHKDEQNGDDEVEDEIDEILDNEDEEELTESEEEDELEEDDCDMSEKVKKKSEFVDEEAEESDEEVEEINEMNEEIHEQEDEEEREVEAGEEDEEARVNDTPEKKVLKRIVKRFDSDESEDEDVVITRGTNLFEMLGRKRVNEANMDEEILTGEHPANYKIRELLTTPRDSEVDFLTPVTFMTGLKTLNTSGSRFSEVKNTSPDENKSDDRIFSSKSEEEPTFAASRPCSSESNLISTQDVLAICSGEFPNSSTTVSSPEISTQQLREIFVNEDSDARRSGSDFDTQDLSDICSGRFTGITLDSKQKEKETVLDEKDEHLISQLIDEEELERFKKKFESPLAENTQKIFGEAEEVIGTGGVIDSDDDEDELTLKKKKRKRLEFSDEESENEIEEEEEEVVDLQDDEDPPSDVAYDSEENEIDPAVQRVTTSNEDRKRDIVSATEFFEKEAELSESEWGSEDEDEKNLDDMEFEKGDEEKFDDDQLRTGIERIQMRQMLDEDNREVKLLQELLLEDGELHGSGRQRQFKWKNIGADYEENEETKVEDDDVYIDDTEESEEQWRKSRHEREQFLMKRRSQLEDDSIISESQKLSFTDKPLKIISQTVMFSETTTETTEKTVEVKKPFSFLNKRGSFLSRSEQILHKLTETSKVSLMTKSANRIVFQAVDELSDKKRKASSVSADTSTPVVLKKMRLSGLSPAVEKKNSKKKKSLFADITLD